MEDLFKKLAEEEIVVVMGCPDGTSCSYVVTGETTPTS